MGARVRCPKCDGPAFRVYSQVPKPTANGKGTLSTSVTLDAVFCGTAGLRDGRGTLTARKGQHGLVAVPHAAIVAARRPRGKPRKPAKAPRPAPKGSARPTAQRGPVAAKNGAMHGDDCPELPTPSA